MAHSQFSEVWESYLGSDEAGRAELALEFARALLENGDEVEGIAFLFQAFEDARAATQQHLAVSAVGELCSRLNEQGRLGESLEALNAVIEFLEPWRNWEFGYVLRSRAWTLKLAGNHEEYESAIRGSISYFRQSAELVEWAVPLENELARYLIELGRRREAANILGGVELDNFKGSPIALAIRKYLWGTTLSWDGDWNNARPLLVESATSLLSTNPDVGLEALSVLRSCSEVPREDILSISLQVEGMEEGPLKRSALSMLGDLENGQVTLFY